MKSYRPVTAVVASLFAIILLSSVISAAFNPMTGLVTGFLSFCYNDEPAFEPYGPFNAVEATYFNYDMNVTDTIYDSPDPRQWSDNATFFNIDSPTGEFGFTLPDTVENDWIGIHPINISYDDGVGCSNSRIETEILINVTWINHPPLITTSYPTTNITFTEEQLRHFNITFSDPDNKNTPVYDDDNLTVEWYMDGVLLKNDSLLSPRNWSFYNYTPDYNSSGIRVFYVYVRDSSSYDVHTWLLNITDVWTNINITQPLNGTSLLIFDNYTIFANLSSFENSSLQDCNITLNIDNKTVFDIKPYESYSKTVPYVTPLGSKIISWDIYTTMVGKTDINVTADCRVGGYTYDSKYTLSVDAPEGFMSYHLPEGIFYNKPDAPPAYGNYRYDFSLDFTNVTTHSDRYIGCFINQSNCYDDALPGCRQIFVNDTTIYGLAFYNRSVAYQIQDDDIIESTLGGATDNWIPWEIDRCGIYYIINMTAIYEVFPKWRIHVHPMEWTTGDIANALNAKSAPNMYMKNTIRSDDQGDITFSVTKYGGTKVELICDDGIDNPEESDTLADCADPECFGITFSCLPKQSYDNSSLYYSPSGSHGTLAIEIPAGDIATNYSTSTTFDTKIDYTMHSMPNGTMKIRLRRWGLSKTATFFIDGLPDIKTVDKYAPGSSSLVTYFLDRNGDPYGFDHLPNSKTYDNRIALRSYLSGGTEIQDLDTILSITFADPASIDMSQGHVLTITINYVEDSTPYEEKMNITVYFDDPTYGPAPRWESDNTKEDEVYIAGTGWYPCNDTMNGDFDLHNCNSNEADCFEQSSYDCYDPDCDMHYGPSAWNDYTGLFTVGQCGYENESQTSSMCFDGYNNDWGTEDITYGHQNTGLSLVDCRDIDCNLVSNGIWRCEHNIELTCDDGYDNDMYNLKDCELAAGGSYDDAEYDCAGFCRNLTGDTTETGTECDDSIDNDWDLFYRTDWSSAAGPYDYAYYEVPGAGIDCGWLTAHPDEDCNMTIMGNSKRCELGRELTCDDEFDNDYDSGHGQPDPGWTEAIYEAYFNTSYEDSADYDDYDCQYSPDVPIAESINDTWCFDNIDNDLDQYFWTGSWNLNLTSGGRDCQDLDCIGISNPANENQTCLEYEYDEDDPFFDGLPTPDLYCKNGFDDDADGPMDCYDSDCNKMFDMCLACPATENITWNSCADNIDNDYGINTDCEDPDCIGYLGDYDHHFCTAPDGENNTVYCSDGFDNDADGLTDCMDTDCLGLASCSADLCDNDKDDDLDGLLDCADPRCRFMPYCEIHTDMSGTYTPPSTSSSDFGGVTAVWTSRVRKGDDFTMNLYKTGSYSAANIYIGRLSGIALPVGMGLEGPGFNISGPDTSAFEASQYNEDAAHTKGQIELIDQIPGTPVSGFNISISIPTSQIMEEKSFEYYHSIDGIPSLGNTVSTIILEDIDPHINSIITEPNDKSNLPYNSSIWVGINAEDPDNGDYNDGTIERCYYSVVGPYGYIASGEDTDDCKFSFSGLVDDGTYTLTTWIRDDNGNYGGPEIINYAIGIIPKYIDGSFTLSDRWYITGDNISLHSAFQTDDASSIALCALYYRDSAGNITSAGNFNATSPVTDIIECDAEIAVPTSDEMYEIWFEITDLEGNKGISDPETFFICNNPESEGININGERWSCAYSDINADDTVDICEQKEIDIMLRKHDTPNPVSRIKRELNYTITMINHGYGTARNVTIHEGYSGLTSYLNSSPIPDSGNNAWIIGNLSENDNASIFIRTIIEENLTNGTIITNRVNLTYINSTNHTESVPLEINTTVIGNTPPIFQKNLPSPHTVRKSDSIALGFDLDNYIFDPDIPQGDIISYETVIETGHGKAEITIMPGNSIMAYGKNLGITVLRFKATDMEGKTAISNRIVITVTSEPQRRRGYSGCIEDWKCSQWSNCGDNGMRYRTCYDRNDCGAEYHKPAEIQLCHEFEPPTCTNGKRDAGEHGIDCGGPCSLDCCENNYYDRNLGEESVDCGGICGECAITEQPAMIFSDMLGVFTSIILLLIILLIPKTLYRGYARYSMKMRIAKESERLNPAIRWLRKKYFEVIRRRGK